MLVQHRPDGRLRLFRQHDHALVSGELAACWIGLEREPSPLPFDLVLATALHDLAWLPLDAVPRLDPESGRPLAFHEFPVREKIEAYASGLDRVERIHPYAGLLGSLHYAAFPDVSAEEAFQEAERERRERLERRLALEAEGEERMARDLEYLRLFDALSIFLCLTPLSADADLQPPWVEATRHADTPDGDAIHLTWMDDTVLHVDPFPFRETLELCLPYRELDGAFESQEKLAHAWHEAARVEAWVEIREPLRLA